MKGLAWFAAAGFLIAGCGKSEPKKPTPVAPNVGAPTAVQSEQFSLTFNDQPLKLGHRLVELKTDLPAPASSNFVRLPSTFRLPYEAYGWSLAGRGFGVIAYNGLIVAAMTVDERGTEEQATDRLSLLKGQDPDNRRVTVTGQKSGYWFLQDGPTLKALVVVSQGGKDRRIVEGVGDEIVLTALRLDPASAKADIAAADKKKLD